MLTECIQNCDYDHIQNYVNANHAHNQNHARSQNNVALIGCQKMRVLITQIMQTTSRNHLHSHVMLTAKLCKGTRTHNQNHSHSGPSL